MSAHRFTQEGKLVLVMARSEAVVLDAAQLGGEHILLACLVFQGSPAAAYLTHRGVDHNVVTAHLAAGNRPAPIAFDNDEKEALAGLGIDLPELLLRLETTIGPAARQPALPRRRPGPRRRLARFGSCAKSTVARATIEATTLRSKAVEPAHLLLSVLREPSPCCRELVTAVGLDYAEALQFMFPTGE